MSVAAIVHGPAYRVALYALLVANTLYFAWAGTRSEALDAAAWLILLALFELETRWAGWLAHGRRRAVFRTMRLVAAAGVIAAMMGYAIGGDVLDAINSVLWIAVVILLEAEVRFPKLVSNARRTFAATAALLYAGLAVLVVLWAVNGQWLDAYDGLLWLIAFATLELKIIEAPRATSKR